MALTTRVLAIGNSTVAIPQGIPANIRRYYQEIRGAVTDVPGGLDGETATLVNSGFFAAVCLSGPTTSRPIMPKAGTLFIDTGISQVLAFDGVGTWHSILTGQAM